MYYGYYCNYTLGWSCMEADGGQNASSSNGTRTDCVSDHLSYSMPLAYFFTIGVSFFITCIILVYRYGVVALSLKMHVLIPTALTLNVYLFIYLIYHEACQCIADTILYSHSTIYDILC